MIVGLETTVVGSTLLTGCGNNGDVTAAQDRRTEVESMSSTTVAAAVVATLESPAVVETQADATQPEDSQRPANPAVARREALAEASKPEERSIAHDEQE